MAHTVQLSIILTTHTESAFFDSLLKQVLHLQADFFEVIVINDAADNETTRFIHEAIEKSRNDRVYLFEHEQPAGRGLSLNEGLIQASGTFIWAPLRADSLHERLLTDTLKRFESDPAVFWSLDHNLPEKPEEWISAAKEGLLPDDSCLIWNREIIRSSSLFFNPFLEHLHGAELAFRLFGENIWHQTDAFFVVADEQQIQASQKDFREFVFTAFRYHQHDENRDVFLQQLSNLKADEPDQSGQDEFLLQSRQLLEQGDARRALETINQYLKKHPEHAEANRIKVTALEKLRRHVEAAEHKHVLQKQKGKEPLAQAELFLQEEKKKEETKKPAASPHPEAGKNIRLSVVIPTTGVGKQPLETTLLHLEKAVDPETTELIVIDNASIDDTFDYLEQLAKEQFLDIQVLTQQTNRGFGASVNLGIEKSRGDHVLVLHNDVIIPPECPAELLKTFSQSEKIALAAPVVDPSDIAAQKKDHAINDSFVLTNQADSCCFMIKRSLDLRFDEAFRLCHFDMQDFCMQFTENSLQIAINRNIAVEHQGGAVTGALGIKLIPQLKWANRDQFNKKWKPSPDFKLPSQGSHPERFEALGLPDHPLNPDPEWLQAVQDYLTDEVKTEILRTEWNSGELMIIVSTLLAADERELLRTLEDLLDDIEIAPALLILFVQYYFNKNIYSRCKHYLKKAGNSHPMFDLYRLKIMVADKELEDASPLLNKMLKSYPASPDLFQLAGDVYRQNGDEGEAKSFYAIANQLDPWRFATEDAAFEIKF